MPWAQQGVLLLNAVLTVERGLAGSHQGKGWEGFTDACIDALNREREGLVFMLWGNYAQAKGKLIDRQRHLVLKAPHPSPLAACRGFDGCGHFSKANEYLKAHGRNPDRLALAAARASSTLPCSVEPALELAAPYSTVQSGTLQAVDSIGDCPSGKRSVP